MLSFLILQELKSNENDFSFELIKKFVNFCMKSKITSLLTIFGISVVMQGCYTQLAVFYPDPSIVDEEQSFYNDYSATVMRPDLSRYAQDQGSGLPLAYSSMQNRFSPFSGYAGYNSFYNPYYMYSPVSYTHLTLPTMS